METSLIQFYIMLLRYSIFQTMCFAKSSKFADTIVDRAKLCSKIAFHVGLFIREYFSQL